jgi:hypothetical protein
MAKTNHPNVYLVKPSYMERVIKSIKAGKRPRVWYLNVFQRPQLENLTKPGQTISRVVCKGKENERTIHVASVKSVEPGSKHRVKIDGKVRVLTIAQKEG